MADAQARRARPRFRRGGDIEQQIDEMVFEQIDLVDVEKAAVGSRQQARLERLLAARQRAFQIERADHAVLGRAERQIDHRHRPRAATLSLRFLGARAAIAAMRDVVVGIALIAAADDRAHRRQQRSERRARRSICRCRGRRTPARRRSADRLPRSAAPASSRPGRRSLKRGTQSASIRRSLAVRLRQCVGLVLSPWAPWRAQSACIRFFRSLGRRCRAMQTLSGRELCRCPITIGLSGPARSPPGVRAGPNRSLEVICASPTG